jgi:hypothetical protein
MAPHEGNQNVSTEEADGFRAERKSRTGTAVQRWGCESALPRIDGYSHQRDPATGAPKRRCIPPAPPAGEPSVPWKVIRFHTDLMNSYFR